MQELRFLERRDHSLIVANEHGDQFQLEVDEVIIAELRSISRLLKPATPKVNPRDVQSMMRSGMTQEEVAEAIEAEIGDIERYAGPILAEFEFILRTAKKVPVRTDTPSEDHPQAFGDVIEDRLKQLGTSQFSWSVWRDAEDGWMIRNTFTSHNVDHEAVWSFDHRKQLLAPLTTDAVNLSKQGEIGERLIPTLRAVDVPSEQDRFDSGAFETLSTDNPGLEQISDSVTDSEKKPDDSALTHPENDESDYARRQEIEHRAITTETAPPQDLGETADLLDALRKRRGERDLSAASEQADNEHTQYSAQNSAPTRSRDSTPSPSDQQPDLDPFGRSSSDQPERSAETAGETERPAKKGRASMPSWDEILFGTRSEED